MDNIDKMTRLHSAGAIVRHISPYEDLTSLRNENALDEAFVAKWIVPFYMTICSHADDEWISRVKEIKNEITVSVCLRLLGEFDWRPKLVGAYFAVVKRFDELIDIIGVHLVKSEVCCVGHIYALVLAFFNTDKSRQYLSQYLDYYLTTPDLYFDQEAVLEAVYYLDKENGTNYFAGYLAQWELLEEKRKPLERQKQQRTIELLRSEGVDEMTLADFAKEAQPASQSIITTYLDTQIEILRKLSI